VLYTRAGPEIAVATTKAYSTQLAAHYLIALWLAEKRGQLSPAQTRQYLAALGRLPNAVAQVLKQTDAAERLAQRLVGAEHAYFIGRNLDYAVAMEAALKLKEISYIHAEAYAAGELKHGTISLIEEGTPVVGIACCEAVTDKTLANLQEVKARGAEVLLVTSARREGACVAEHVLYVPRTEPLFMPSLAVVPMQLLGYYVARARGCDIDKPRNLAKSVTVE
jgi:glucosamine--fructose-6-phosphate aminotransferase (isomerizing)